MTIQLDDPRYEAFAEARDAFWRSVGTLDANVMAYLVSPQFSGAPAWPTTRQAFRIVRCPESAVIASDGLTDLFVGTDLQSPGFETEVFIETDALMGADFEQIKQSWEFSLIECFARNVAHWGGIRPKLDKLGVMSVELPAPEGMPAAWVDGVGMVGCLVNMPSSRTRKVELGAGANILMVPLTIVTPRELAFLAQHGAAARADLTRALLEQGHGIVSRVGRASLK